MTCDDALNLLFEADLDELASNPRDPLARHLEECERCQAVARALGDAEAGLAAALPVQPRRTADAVVDDVLTVGKTDEVGWRRRKWRAGWSFGVPVAAAAAIAALVLRGTDPAPGVDPPVLVREEIVSDIEVPGGHSAAIFRTSNPRITVVWIYQENGI